MVCLLAAGMVVPGLRWLGRSAAEACVVNLGRGANPSLARFLLSVKCVHHPHRCLHQQYDKPVVIGSAPDVNSEVFKVRVFLVK
jgi:hypothetical protein